MTLLDTVNTGIERIRALALEGKHKEAEQAVVDLEAKLDGVNLDMVTNSRLMGVYTLAEQASLPKAERDKRFAWLA